jgi:acetyl-CoA carboxylase carboxyl transferase subunit beta
MVYVPYDYYDPNYKYIYSKDGELLNPPGLTVLEYLKQQRKIKDLLNPLSMGERGDPSIGLWTRCEDCGTVLYIRHLHENDDLCMHCGFHLKMSSTARIKLLVDEGSWRPLFETMSSCDPLEFEDYDVYIERITRSQKNTQMQDAVQTGTAFIDTIPVALAVMDFAFMGGSMGSVVGEKITRLIEYATQRGLTLVIVCASGGARMQEGSLSLVQMAKISAALFHHQNCARIPYATLLTSPTTGGVTASFGMLADFILTEPKSLIGFAGRRVIEATIGEVLPANFQTAEYMMERGQVDVMVERKHIREVLSNLLWPATHGYYKRYGFIPMGGNDGLTSVLEERVRRLWLTEYLEEKSKSKTNYPMVKEPKELINMLSLGDTCNDGVVATTLVENQEIEASAAEAKVSKTGEVLQPEGLIETEKLEPETPTSQPFQGVFYPKQGLPYSDYELEQMVDPKDLFTNRVVLKNRDEFPFGMLKDLQSLSTLVKTTGDGKGNFVINKGRPALQPTRLLTKTRYFEKVEQWFGNLSSQKAYRELLLNFESVFNMFTQEIASREGNQCESIPFQFNYDRDSESKQFNVLDEAIAFAKVQSVRWKAFYLAFSLPPKIEFFKNYSIGFSSSLESKDYEMANENKFYYRVLLKKANLLETREADQLEDPTLAENEKIAKRKADQKAKEEAERVKADIEANLQFVLQQRLNKLKPAKKSKNSKITSIYKKKKR